MNEMIKVLIELDYFPPHNTKEKSVNSLTQATPSYR